MFRPCIDRRTNVRSASQVSKRMWAEDRRWEHPSPFKGHTNDSRTLNWAVNRQDTSYNHFTSRCLVFRDTDQPFSRSTAPLAGRQKSSALEGFLKDGQVKRCNAGLLFQAFKIGDDNSVLCCLNQPSLSKLLERPH